VKSANARTEKKLAANPAKDQENERNTAGCTTRKEGFRGDVDEHRNAWRPGSTSVVLLVHVRTTLVDPALGYQPSAIS
jgi:hypothetical protein